LEDFDRCSLYCGCELTKCGQADWISQAGVCRKHDAGWVGGPWWLRNVRELDKERTDWPADRWPTELTR